MTFGSLFAGIGGFDLGLERAGMRCLWQVEIDPWCRVVLEKHWPEMRRYADVRDVHGEAAHVADARSAKRWTQAEGRQHDGNGNHAGRQEATSGFRECGDDGLLGTCTACLPAVDLVCGGFPCQPHSLAGKRNGSADERDLWGEFARVIREVRPRWVLAENVPGLLSTESGRFFGRILRDLAASGYDAEWDCIPASAVGAPHRRDRVWIVAYPYGDNGGSLLGTRDGESSQGMGIASRDDIAGLCADVADANGDNGYGWRGDVQMGQIWREGEAPRYDDLAGTQWRTEPDVGRVAHGVPARVDRLRGLGNSIVPQVAEWLGRRILDADLT